MQKDTLLALLYQPENLLEDHLEDLEEIIQKYPYFHIPHALVAKLLHNRQSSLASQKIRKASLYVYNRAIFKDFILQNPNRIDVEEEFSYQDNPHRNTFANIQQEIDEFEKKMETASIEDLEKELASITESYLPKDYLLEETQNNNFEPAEQTENQKEQNSLIDDFLNNFNKTVEPILELEEDQTEEEAIKLFEQGNTQAAIAIYEQLKLKHLEKAAYYQSQIDIFSMDFGSTNFTTTQELQETEQKAQETTTETTNIFSETNLDNIDTNFSNNLENQSTETSSEITEAQAIEYFNQGNVAKAIEIYRQLMLQNPDKKAYFASQIEILES